MIETRQEVLVVAESDTQALQLSGLLRDAGYAVRMASNGAHALELAHARIPDVILSEIGMPVLNGFDMCRRVKGDPVLREVPVVLLTALNSMQEVVRGLESGADNLIRKPVDPEYLLARVRHVLDSRNARRESRVQMGLRIQLGGETHFIDAERQQILDLLVSTYEEAVRMTEQLRVQKQHLTDSYQSLEGLYRIAAAIGPALHAPQVARLALDGLLGLTGFAGGAVLLGAEGRVQMTAASGLAQGCEPCPIDRDCGCRALASGASAAALGVDGDCALLGAASGAALDELERLVLPLQVGDRTLGAVVLLGNSAAPCTDSSGQVLGTAVHQVAVAIERALLYSEMEAQVRERTEALNAERHLMSSIVNATGALVMLVDADGRIVLFNPACEAVLGWHAEEVAGRLFWELFLEPVRAAATRRAMQEGRLTGGGPHGESWRARDGSERRIIWTVRAIDAVDRARPYWLGAGLDVTESEGMRERLRYLSSFDALTGLPNGSSMRARLEQALAVQEDRVIGLLWIRCGRLALVRESLGVAAENALLTGIAARLQRWRSGDDWVARCDDTAFAVLAVRARPDEMANLAAEILDLLDPPFQSGEDELHAGVSLGVAVAPSDGSDYDSLVRAAAAAARQARAQNGVLYAFHRPERLQAASERLRLEGALRQALARGELLLHYQPQVSLETGKIVGFEALLRWRHPVLGMVAPSRFIGIAEETGLILPIGDWALRQACRQLRSWRALGLPLVPVAVNLSARQFSGQIVETVRTVLEETGVDPSLLGIELTESVSMDDPESSFRILAALRALGVQLAIDDFGTGYSNLNYLKRFPVEKLKLDQSFVRELVSSPDDLAISRAVIAMAHSLRLRVIAEGVETDGQLALLRSNGCDEMQGYLFSRPLEAEDAARMLAQGALLQLPRPGPDAGFGVLYLGSDEVRLSGLRSACGAAAVLYVAATAEEGFELLAARGVALLVLDCVGDARPYMAFLEAVGQLHPDVVQLGLADDGDSGPEAAPGCLGPACAILRLPSDAAALARALSDALRSRGLPLTGAPRP